jgi:hypothetical protein
MTARQIGLDLERAPVEPRASAYTIVKCVCGARVVVGAGVSAVGCPKCRQMVSGDLLGGGR